MFWSFVHVEFGTWSKKNLICANIQAFILESMVSNAYGYIVTSIVHCILTQLIRCDWRIFAGTVRSASNENIICTLNELNNFKWYLSFTYFGHFHSNILNAAKFSQNCWMKTTFQNRMNLIHYWVATDSIRNDVGPNVPHDGLAIIASKMRTQPRFKWKRISFQSAVNAVNSVQNNITA